MGTAHTIVASSFLRPAIKTTWIWSYRLLAELRRSQPQPWSLSKTPGRLFHQLNASGKSSSPAGFGVRPLPLWLLHQIPEVPGLYQHSQAGSSSGFYGVGIILDTAILPIDRGFPPLTLLRPSINASWVSYLPLRLFDQIYQRRLRYGCGVLRL